MKQQKLNELHLFAGAGGGILGGILCGHTCVCAVEIEPYPRKVLLQRQRDEILPRFPIWDDVRTFDGKPWRGKVDIVCGGFPCQDISAAGSGEGINGERSGLWSEMRRIIGEVRPRYAFVENSPMLTLRGIGTVLGDLAEMGYDARWGVLGSDIVGADHHRARIWMVADSNMRGLEKCRGEAKPIRPQQTREGNYRQASERPLLGMDDGLASWVDRHHAIGNGQVPSVARLAWETLTQQK
jgi:DNA (cytosine-5)-methyltransferase 1